MKTDFGVLLKLCPAFTMPSHSTANSQSLVASTDVMTFTCTWPFMNITPWYKFSVGGKCFHTPLNSSLSSQADRWLASLLCLNLSSCWPLRKNYLMAKKKPCHHFLVGWIQLPAPLNLCCSFLVQFELAAAEKRRCQLTTQQQADAAH